MDKTVDKAKNTGPHQRAEWHPAHLVRGKSHYKIYIRYSSVCFSSTLGPRPPAPPPLLYTTRLGPARGGLVPPPTRDVSARPQRARPGCADKHLVFFRTGMPEQGTTHTAYTCVAAGRAGLAGRKKKVRTGTPGPGPLWSCRYVPRGGGGRTGPHSPALDLLCWVGGGRGGLGPRSMCWSRACRFTKLNKDPSLFKFFMIF